MRQVATCCKLALPAHHQHKRRRRPLAPRPVTCRPGGGRGALRRCQLSTAGCRPRSAASGRRATSRLPTFRNLVLLAHPDMCCLLRRRPRRSPCLPSTPSATSSSRTALCSVCPAHTRAWPLCRAAGSMRSSSASATRPCVSAHLLPPSLPSLPSLPSSSSDDPCPLRSRTRPA